VKLKKHLDELDTIDCSDMEGDLKERVEKLKKCVVTTKFLFMTCSFLLNKQQASSDCCRLPPTYKKTPGDAVLEQQRRQGRDPEYSELNSILHPRLYFLWKYLH
jgi:hypothetical protein